jgi:hypothetical protein
MEKHIAGFRIKREINFKTANTITIKINIHPAVPTGKRHTGRFVGEH